MTIEKIKVEDEVKVEVKKNPIQKYLKFHRHVILNSLIHIRSSLSARIPRSGQNEMLNQVQTL